MAPFKFLSNNNLLHQNHPRSDNSMSRSDISGLSIAAIGVLLTAISVIGSWKFWQRRKNRVQSVSNQVPSENDPALEPMPHVAPPTNTHYRLLSVAGVSSHVFGTAAFAEIHNPAETLSPIPQAIPLQILCPLQETLSQQELPHPPESLSRVATI